MQSKSQNDIKIEKLVNGMTSLNLISYGSADIGRFESCVNPDPKRKAWALETAKKNLQNAGTTTMGLMGTGVNNRRDMASTAKKVQERKIGVCHELAQLGADHLLKQMDAGVIPRSSLKIVSHKAGYGGTHTFLLLDHTGDLSDLSKCVIVDPWAVTMGFVDKQGVYTSSNYPYNGMTKNLKLVFEVDIHGNEIANTAEKAAVNVVPPEERGDREKVRVSQEPMNLQSVLRSTGFKESLLSENKTKDKPEKSVADDTSATDKVNPFQSVLRRTAHREALVGEVKPKQQITSERKPEIVSRPAQQTEKPVASENNVPKVSASVASQIPPAPVASAAVRETQRHSSMFHASSQMKTGVSKNDAINLLKAYYAVVKTRETASHKKQILTKLAIGVRDDAIDPGRAVLLAVDLLMTNDKRVGENSWSRKGEPSVENLKEAFRSVNEVDTTKSISNFLRQHAGLPNSDKPMRNEGELRQVSGKILNDPEVVRDVSSQNNTGLRV